VLSSSVGTGKSVLLASLAAGCWAQPDYAWTATPPITTIYRR